MGFSRNYCTPYVENIVFFFFKFFLNSLELPQTLAYLSGILAKFILLCSIYLFFFSGKARNAFRKKNYAGVVYTIQWILGRKIYCILFYGKMDSWGFWKTPLIQQKKDFKDFYKIHEMLLFIFIFWSSITIKKWDLQIWNYETFFF